MEAPMDESILPPLRDPPLNLACVIYEPAGESAATAITEALLAIGGTRVMEWCWLVPFDEPHAGILRRTLDPFVFHGDRLLIATVTSLSWQFLQALPQGKPVGG
jgi:hypothetical protein